MECATIMLPSSSKCWPIFQRPLAESPLNLVVFIMTSTVRIDFVTHRGYICCGLPGALLLLKPKISHRSLSLREWKKLYMISNKIHKSKSEYK